MHIFHDEFMFMSFSGLMQAEFNVIVSIKVAELPQLMALFSSLFDNCQSSAFSYLLIQKCQLVIPLPSVSSVLLHINWKTSKVHKKKRAKAEAVCLPKCRIQPLHVEPLNESFHGCMGEKRARVRWCKLQTFKELNIRRFTLVGHISAFYLY